MAFQIGSSVPAGSEIRLRVVLEPTRDATALPDHVLDLYGETIANGTIASLMLLPGQPFSNPQMAGVMAAPSPKLWRAPTRANGARART